MSKKILIIRRRITSFSFMVKAETVNQISECDKLAQNIIEKSYEKDGRQGIVPEIQM